MTEKTFNYIWENALDKAIQNVMKCISDDVKSEYNLSYINDYERKKADIKYEYNIQRQNVRNLFFDVGKEKENLIDIHKICACFTAAVLKVRVFEYTEKMPMKSEIFYSNYTLAFLVGIHIIYLGLVSDYDKMEDKKLYNLLNERASLVFPETNDGHDKYLQGRIKTLALNDIYEIDFDILTYADMLYWIEKYNKELLNSIVSCT